MEIRFQNSPKETSQMNTQELRSNFLVQNLLVNDEVKLVYSHYDRVIIGGAKPVTKPLKLENHPELRAEYFLERREIGIINVGGTGQVEADGQTFDLEKLSCVYLGKGTKDVTFKSNSLADPAVFYLLSAPAHQTYPAARMTKDEASPGTMGAQETANQRTIYRYIHLDGLKSCQLVMGLTILNTGSVWNTMPAHTHTRRMEAYFYFDVPEEHRVVHFMGEPQETRHLLVANQEAIISPPWSIHSGCGTASYGFIWGMAGENLVYSDMDAVPISGIR
ncbi:5-dehydro-4-deoxy-D-glucuronate isomerase [Mucilaginibacter arboris]|uniref:4-deoxy-L-threo-5-hexosulose-uronate ketol-isomerase n=1 Tax=Mucilaginibacter arboris TaxID=2682090 RepID=A0A7K1SZ35_9SPHI|nr:5-dehydro-4-deoxy-D-glucuronate isomerase [Mucilaginibacter arboris]MVN22563.1 5-dehydro-4-deoxy-D-glucuronate isomerase [Mucilaginibacter arboris]